MITGCLPDDARPDYKVEFPSNDVTVILITSDLSVGFTFGSVDQVNDMELDVTITPVISDLRLLGIPVTTTLPHNGKLVYVHVAIKDVP